MKSAIEELRVFAQKIRDDRWKDERGRRAVLTGVEMSIARLELVEAGS